MQAAAPRSTLIALLVAILMGAAILFPSLGLLFGLLLRGHLGEPGSAATGEGPGIPGGGERPVRSTPLQARLAVALLIVGVGFLNAADAGWAHVIGVFALFGFIVIGFAAIVPRALAEDS
jgi:cytochrome d ubiquinol oxidase subunit II